MFRCPVKQILQVRNALYFSKVFRQMFLPRVSLKRRMAFRVGRWLIGLSVRSADVVTTPTQAMLDELREYVEVPPHKAIVNPYGAELPCGTGDLPRSIGDSPVGEHGRGEWPFALSESQDGKSGQPPPNPLLGKEGNKGWSRVPCVRLLYVSLYCEHKDLGTLLKAMPLLNRDGGESFVLHTTANPHWDEVADTVTRGQDIAFAQRPEIARWVQIAGPLSKEETERLYLASDVFIFPSLTESFGFPMVEAMAHGLPIVAADTPVNREVCGDAALYFRTQDSNDLAEKVRSLCADEALRRRCSAGGRARAASHFRWEEHAARLLALCSVPISRSFGTHGSSSPRRGSL
jgi:glycosyltransferase involved in cell wall biosynthesis